MANVLDLYNRFKGGGSGAKLVYPLENQSDYLGKMTFTPIEEAKVDMTEQTGNLKDLAIEAVKIGYDAVSKLITDAVDPKTSDAADKTLNLPGNADGTTGSYGNTTKQSSVENISSRFYGARKVEASKAFDEGALKQTIGKRISLYLPRAIQIQDTVVYDNAFQLGLIGGAIEAGAGSPGGAVAAGLGAIASEAGGFANTLLGRTGGMSSDAAGILSGKLAARIPGIGDAAGGAIRSATRLTTNPNTRALFQNVPIRNFSFAFQLVPTSRAEARVIEDIIKTFREELYPEALTAGGVNVGYRFPNRFLIKVKYNNADIKGIKFLPVYMQSFNATYNSATGGMHNDGRFSAVDISMAFTETRAIAKADVRDGNY
jgi:hypothetical protein